METKPDYLKSTYTAPRKVYNPNLEKPNHTVGDSRTATQDDFGVPEENKQPAGATADNVESDSDDGFDII